MKKIKQIGINSREALTEINGINSKKSTKFFQTIITFCLKTKN